MATFIEHGATARRPRSVRGGLASPRRPKDSSAAVPRSMTPPVMLFSFTPRAVGVRRSSSAKALESGDGRLP